MTVALAFAVEFKTSPKSPPVGLVPPTLDLKKERGKKKKGKKTRNKIS